MFAILIKEYIQGMQSEDDYFITSINKQCL